MITKSEFLQKAQSLTPTCNRLALDLLYSEYRHTENDNPDQFILEHFTQPGMVLLDSVLCSRGTIDSSIIMRCQSLLKQLHIDIYPTLCGFYITQSGAVQLDSFLNNAIPLFPEVKKFCASMQHLLSPAVYNRFLTQNKSKVQKTCWHPFCIDSNEFWNGSQDELLAALQLWAGSENANEPVFDQFFFSVSEAAKILSMEKSRLIDWLTLHPGSYTYRDGQILLDKSWVITSKNEWAAAIPLKEKINALVSGFPTDQKNKIRSQTAAYVNIIQPAWIIPPGHYPQQEKGSYIYHHKSAAAHYDLFQYVNTLPVWNLRELSPYTKLSIKTLRARVNCGDIRGETQEDGKILVSTNELHRIQTMSQQYMQLDLVVNQVSIYNNSDFDYSNANHRRDLLLFAEDHSWWDIEIYTEAQILCNGGKFGLFLNKEDAETLRSSISLWVCGYHKSYSRQIEILLEHYKEKYPKTTKTICNYYMRTQLSKAHVDMIDRLLCLLPGKELSEMTEAEIDQTIIHKFTSSTLVSGSLLAEFLLANKFTTKQYSFDKTGYKINVSAYPIKDFAVMVAPIVNEEIIKELNLISKAITVERFASLWLYIALHVYSSWRDSDYLLLEAPVLRRNPDEVLQLIRSGAYPADEAVWVSDQFIARHQLMWRSPNKTKNADGIPPLYFFCPESCKYSFGLILSISAAHYYKSERPGSFIKCIKDRSAIIGFFGKPFLEACGNKKFSGRRANKSLMQAVEYECREDGQYNPLVAYNLASQMRSHKGGYGTISETTDIYLRDAKFSGISPDYIVYQMMERGVCSFAVDIMLKQCYGPAYTNLSVSSQSIAIRRVSIPIAHQDAALRASQIAMDAAIETVRELACTGDSIETALQNIAIGNAHGKDLEIQCLAKAAGLSCRCPERANCLGCKYELKTKALLIKYISAHQSIIKRIPQEERLLWIDQKVIVPAIAEIASHMREATVQEEFQLYTELVKEVEYLGPASSSTT